MENVWLNLPVKNLDKTDRFFRSLGFQPNGENYKNEELVSFLAGTNGLIVHFFKQEILEKFIESPICDTTKFNEMIITIGSKSEDEIRELAKIIEKSGGKILKSPQSDESFLVALLPIQMVTNGIFYCLKKECKFKLKITKYELRNPF